MLKVKVISKYLVKHFDLSKYETNVDFLNNIREYDYIHFKDNDIEYALEWDIKEIVDFIKNHENNEYKFYIYWN